MNAWTCFGPRKRDYNWGNIHLVYFLLRGKLPESTESSFMPVMVYVHGGGFGTGSGSYSQLGPEYILNEDVVLVVLNYRLGSLGFLSTGNEIASGNWGLKDQILALQWIQENIEYFGGDADQVTLFGESAGGIAVDLLTLTNATIGLFHRCITQSGSALATYTYQTKATAVRQAFELGEYFGCSNNTSNSLISCLRTVDFADIIRYTQSSFWGPTDEPDVAGAILTDSPTNLFAAGKVRVLPQISGIVRDEQASATAGFHDDEKSFLAFLENFDSILPSLLGLTDQSDSGAAWVSAIKFFYFNDDLTTNTSLLLSNLTLLLTDRYFHYSAYNALQQRLALEVNPQYFYTFNYRGTFSESYFFSGSTMNYGVVHTDDLLYLFPSESKFADLNETMSEADFEMVNIMVQLWTSFAMNGTPTTTALDSNSHWEPYSNSEKFYLRIGNESDVTPEVQYSNFEERMQFWASLEASLKSTTESDGSGTVTASPNLLMVLLLVTYSKCIILLVATDGLF